MLDEAREQLFQHPSTEIQSEGLPRLTPGRCPGVNDNLSIGDRRITLGRLKGFLLVAGQGLPGEMGVHLVALTPGHRPGVSRSGCGQLFRWGGSTDDAIECAVGALDFAGRLPCAADPGAAPRGQQHLDWLIDVSSPRGGVPGSTTGGRGLDQPLTISQRIEAAGAEWVRAPIAMRWAPASA